MEDMECLRELPQTTAVPSAENVDKAASNSADSPRDSGVSDQTADSIREKVFSARTAFDSGRTRSLAWRRSQLRALDAMLTDSQDELNRALFEDLHKNPVEANLTELGVVKGEIKLALRKLNWWSRPRHAQVPAAFMPASAKIVPEPLGVILIISPWNYPVHLLLLPLVGVLAAGNAAVLKPSELALATSQAIARLLPQYLDDEAVQVIEGAVPETTELLSHRFDHIVYTGNAKVARIVMRAAAKNLTSVTLELGGKSPVWVNDASHIDQVAGRIAWGKFVNAGQTCVAPDYVLTTPGLARPLATALERAITDRWGTDPQQSADYGRIINARQFDRLASYLPSHNVSCAPSSSPGEREPDVASGDGPKSVSTAGPRAVSGEVKATSRGKSTATASSATEAPDKTGAILSGGTLDRDDLYIAPTVMLMPEDTYHVTRHAGQASNRANAASNRTEIPPDRPAAPNGAGASSGRMNSVKPYVSPAENRPNGIPDIMSEEIFGPILPIVTVPNLSEAIAYINRGEKPLAIYSFGANRGEDRRLERETSSGSFSAGSTIIHAGAHTLPFGGVGESGMGRYHGTYSFEAFSHMKPVLRKPLRPDTLRLVQPPYNQPTHGSSEGTAAEETSTTSKAARPLKKRLVTWIASF